MEDKIFTKKQIIYFAEWFSSRYVYEDDFENGKWTHIEGDKVVWKTTNELLELFIEKNNMVIKRKPVAKKVAPKKPRKKAIAKKAVKRATPKKTGGCYFTTACTEYFGLPDNCTQLKTLRNFRDTVMIKTKEGRELVKLYYRVAPEIVLRIKNNQNHKEEFGLIFNNVNNACALIKGNRNKEARNCYEEMVNHLINKYL